MESTPLCFWNEKGWGVYMEKKMTKAQAEVYLIIDEWWKKFGFGPSVEDIQRFTGDRSKATVHGKMKRLVKLGHCKYTPRRARSIRPSYMRIRDIE